MAWLLPHDRSRRPGVTGLSIVAATFYTTAASVRATPGATRTATFIADLAASHSFRPPASSATPPASLSMPDAPPAAAAASPGTPPNPRTPALVIGSVRITGWRLQLVQMVIFGAVGALTRVPPRAVRSRQVGWSETVAHAWPLIRLRRALGRVQRLLERRGKISLHRAERGIAGDHARSTCSSSTARCC